MKALLFSLVLCISVCYSQNKTLHFNINTYKNSISSKEDQLQSYTYVIQKIDSLFNPIKDNNGFKYFIMCNGTKYFQLNSLYDNYCKDYYMLGDTIVTFINPIAIKFKKSTK